MKACIIDNMSRDMAGVLCTAIEQSEDVRIAVAFVSQHGLDTIGPSVESSLAAGGDVEFLVGLDMHVTEPRALQTIYDLSLKNSSVALYCHASLTRQAMYHPKLYLLRARDEVTVIIGSSNLTRGGLETNIEANVLIQANAQTILVSDAYDTYNQLKFHQHRVIPDQEFLTLYSRLHQRAKGRRQRVSRDRLSDEFKQTFREKVNSLRRPVLRHRDLVGWLGLVYDCLPDGEFTNQEVYAYEQAFEERYPANRNIRAKVRQQLQFLRDWGLIEHLGPGRWRKPPRPSLLDSGVRSS